MALGYSDGLHGARPNPRASLHVTLLVNQPRRPASPKGQGAIDLPSQGGLAMCTHGKERNWFRASQNIPALTSYPEVARRSFTSLLIAFVDAVFFGGTRRCQLLKQQCYFFVFTLCVLHVWFVGCGFSWPCFTGWDTQDNVEMEGARGTPSPSSHPGGEGSVFRCLRGYWIHDGLHQAESCVTVKTMPLLIGFLYIYRTSPSA